METLLGAQKMRGLLHVLFTLSLDPLAAFVGMAGILNSSSFFASGVSRITVMEVDSVGC